MNHAWTAAEQSRLKRRATALSKASMASTSTTWSTRLVLLFCMGNDPWAMPAAAVIHVNKRPKITPVLGASTHVAGVFMYGDQVLPAFHLQTLIGHSMIKPVESDHVLVIGRNRPEVGMVVQAIDEFREVEERSISALPEKLRVSNVEYCSGLIDGRTPLIDPELLLNGPLLYIGHPPDKKLSNQ